MRYAEWNKLIAQHFFNPDMAGRPVYLHVTGELLSELGRDAGIGEADFLAAVQQDSGGPGAPHVCIQALYWYRSASGKDATIPGYLGYLALFALAADHVCEGRLSPLAYYPHLNKLLGAAGERQAPRFFDRMRELWLALEHWSCVVMDGELGEYHFLCVGRCHVGVPMAQAILTGTDRAALPGLFHAAGLDPLDPPDADKLLSKLVHFGCLPEHSLLRRTLRIADPSETQDREQRAALALIVLEELRQWDGQVSAPTVGRDHLAFLSMRLSFVLERVARRASFTLRCTSTREIPEDGISLLHRKWSGCLYAALAQDSWSEPLWSENGSCEVDAATFSWLLGERFKVCDSSRTVYFPGRSARVFLDSDFSSGMVEALRLPQDGRFFLAVRREDRDVVESWGRKGCRRCQRLDIGDGIPAGWDLWEGDSATSDEGIRQIGLAFPSEMRIRLSGGVRAVNGKQHYFAFAPPRVAVDGWAPEAEVRSNGTKLIPACWRTRPGVFQIPPVECDGGACRLQIELSHAGSIIDRRSLLLRLDDPAAPRSPVKWFDATGREAPGEEGNPVRITGLLVRGRDYLPEQQRQHTQRLPPNLAAQARRLFSLGVSSEIGVHPLPASIRSELQSQRIYPECRRLLSLGPVSQHVVVQVGELVKKVSKWASCCPHELRNHRADHIPPGP